MNPLPPDLINGPPPAPLEPKKQNPWLWLTVAIVCTVVCCGIPAMILLPLFASARVASKRVLAVSQTKQLGVAISIYEADYDDRLPPMQSSKIVANLIRPYVRGEEAGDLLSYDYNAKLSYVSLISIKNLEKVWLFHSRSEVEGAYAVGFADSHAAQLSQDNLNSVLERPVQFEK